MESTSLYLHIPFCKQRCAYCDFNTYAGIEALIPDYVQALCREIGWIGSRAEARLLVHTIYLGGGTPSLLPSAAIEEILHTIRINFSLFESAEITLEANPGTLARQYLSELQSLGVNRLSIGMQSAHHSELKTLARIHDYQEVVASVRWARQAGFTNINLDLIYGIPEQTIQSWRRSIELALGLQPEHLSLYALSLEDETMLKSWVRKGLLTELDQDVVADMYEMAEELLDQAGYQSYEISNWAMRDSADVLLACQHNLQYWRGKPYLGFGAGAHGYINHTRTVNIAKPDSYIKQMTDEFSNPQVGFPCNPATAEFRILDQASEMGEWMMMGLRLTQEGVSAKMFSQQFGLTLEQKFGAQIQQLIDQGLLEWGYTPTRVLRLTKRGRLLGNRVFREFI